MSGSGSGLRLELGLGHLHLDWPLRCARPLVSSVLKCVSPSYSTAMHPTWLGFGFGFGFGFGLGLGLALALGLGLGLGLGLVSRLRHREYDPRLLRAFEKHSPHLLRVRPGSRGRVRARSGIKGQG